MSDETRSAYYVGKTIGIMRREAEPPITVQELAVLAQCSPSHLHNIENGRNHATFRLLEKIADALGVGVVAFVSRYATLRKAGLTIMSVDDRQKLGGGPWEPDAGADVPKTTGSN